MRPLAAMRMILSAAAIALSALSCEREERGFRVDPPSADTVRTSTPTDFRAGPSTQASTRPATGPASQPSSGVKNQYEDNAYALNEGKRLYSQMNCVGCHAHGGGDKGPALMDDRWIYGSNPEQVFATIVEGRPNGMPSFMGRIPDYQVWQIVAYVRSLSGQVRKDAAPGRNDHMKANPPENSKDKEQPKQVSTHAVEMPG